MTLKRYTFGLVLAAAMSFSVSADDCPTCGKAGLIAAGVGAPALVKDSQTDTNIGNKTIRLSCPGDPGCPPPIDSPATTPYNPPETDIYVEEVSGPVGSPNTGVATTPVGNVARNGSANVGLIFAGIGAASLLAIVLDDSSNDVDQPSSP